LSVLTFWNADGSTFVEKTKKAGEVEYESYQCTFSHCTLIIAGFKGKKVKGKGIPVTGRESP
jgi:hypothetical protein